ncbi:amidase signature enzyme [Phlegmacium glaucopus]|nr:amidase signature enzyme [Phlegmacium glaucopus]
MNLFWGLLYLFSFATASEWLDILTTHPSGTVFKFTNDPIPDVIYLIHPNPTSYINLDTIDFVVAGSTSFNLPATSIHVDSNTPRITKKFLRSQLDEFSEIDDVWNRQFLKSVILYYDGQTPVIIDDQANRWLRNQGVTTLFLSGSIEWPAREAVPTYKLPHKVDVGPIIISRIGEEAHLGFHNVYRLYVDEYESFLFGAIPDLIHAGWILTNFTVPDDEIALQLIPVPSRLRSRPTPDFPLAGTRFGLKDIYHARGLPTAAGSIAYQLTHNIPEETAPSIEMLLDLGAIMVGKTRTSQFAHGAHPWEFVDVPYSWNPRADGYLTASASSSGSACAIAAYQWLDFTVGSDTRGSVRKPAALVGVYGIRPSHGSMDLTGVVPLSEEMDTAGFFARDPQLFYEIVSEWYIDSPVANKKMATRFPEKLLYPIDHFPRKSPAAQEIIDRFVEDLHSHLNITPVPVSSAEIFTPFFPNGSFSEFQLSSNKLAEYRSWTTVGKPIVDEFYSRFGRQPQFDPIPQKMFERAKSITEKDFADAVALKRAFQDSVSRHIFKQDETSCSNSIFIYDAATGGLPSYRFEEFNHISGATPFLLTAPGADKEPQLSDFLNFLASMADLPEITVPIGQVKYFSPVSRTWEALPIAVQLVTRKGCDRMLLDLVGQLADMEIVKEVNVGRYTF